MILRQYLHDRPAVAASYLLGCGGKGEGIVVDPVEDIGPYLEDSKAHGLQLRYVIDTHVHADHVSGGRALAEATGAEYVLWSGVEADYPFRAAQDGDAFAAGNVELRVLHTPGHTPEHLSLLLVDRSRADEPWAVLTGHTLMVGDMGRTELASDPAQGALALFRSAERFRSLPDHLEVLPGAFSGSVCGRGLSGKPFSTIGYERRFNRAFRQTDQEIFVRLMLENIPPPPPRAMETRAYNLGKVTVPA